MVLFSAPLISVECLSFRPPLQPARPLRRIDELFSFRFHWSRQSRSRPCLQTPSSFLLVRQINGPYSCLTNIQWRKNEAAVRQHVESGPDRIINGRLHKERGTCG